jgi:hypothetical protein
MSRTTYITERVERRLHESGLRTIVPTPIFWHLSPVPDTYERGWLPPVALTARSMVVTFCPEVIDAATDTFNDTDLDHYLDVLILVLEAHARFPHLDDETVTTEVTRHLADNDETGLTLYLQAAINATDLANGRPQPQPATPVGVDLDVATRLDVLIHPDHRLQTATGRRWSPQFRGGFRPVDFERRTVTVNPERIAALSADLDADQREVWLATVITAAYHSGQKHRYQTTPDTVVNHLVRSVPDETFLLILAAQRLGLSLAQLLGEDPTDTVSPGDHP